MAISTRKWSPRHHEIAKEKKIALVKWEMDKRYAEDPNERIVIQMCGTMSLEKASRIWAIINKKA